MKRTFLSAVLVLVAATAVLGQQQSGQQNYAQSFYSPNNYYPQLYQQDRSILSNDRQFESFVNPESIKWYNGAMNDKAWGLQLPEEKKQEEKKDEQPTAAQKFTMLLDGVDQTIGVLQGGVGLAQSIMGMFKSESSETLQDSLTGQGYEHFKHSSQIRTFTLAGEIYEEYVRRELERMTNIPSKHRENVDRLIREAGMVDTNSWQDTQGVFDIGKGGENAVIQVFTAKDMSCNRMSVVIITSDNTFRLKPDMFIIQKSKSTMGGTFSDSKLVFDEKDAGLNQADLEFVSTYFLGIALEQLKASQGLLLQTQAGANCGPWRPLPKQCNPWQKNPKAKDFCGGHLEVSQPGPPRPAPMPQQPMPQQPMQQGGYGGPPMQQGGYGEQYPMQSEDPYGNGEQNPMQQGGYGEQYPMQSGDPYGNGENGDNPMDGGYPSDGEYGGESYENDDDDDDDDDDGGKRVKKKDRKKRRKGKRGKGKRGKKGKNVRRKPSRKRGKSRTPSRKRGKSRKPRKDVRKKRRKPSRKRRKSRKPSRKRRKSRKPSRKRRKSRKPSRKRRKSRKPSRKRKSRRRGGKKRGGKKRGGRKLRGSVFPSSDRVRRLFVRPSVFPSSGSVRRLFVRRSGGRRLTWDEYDQCSTRCMAGKPRMYSTWTTWSSHCDGKCDYLIDI